MMTFTPLGRSLGDILSRLTMVPIQELPVRLDEFSDGIWEVFRRPDGNLMLRHPISFTYSVVSVRENTEFRVRVFMDRDGDLCTDNVWVRKHQQKAAYIMGALHAKTI